MVKRQPSNDERLLALLECSLDLILVMQKVAMAQHNAFRRRGGAGGILKKGQCVTVNRRLLPTVLGTFGNLVESQPPEWFKVRILRELRRDPGENRCGRECDGRLRVVHDCL